jgi:hypothetical protein
MLIAITYDGKRPMDSDPHTGERLNSLAGCWIVRARMGDVALPVPRFVPSDALGISAPRPCVVDALHYNAQNDFWRHDLVCRPVTR